MQHTTTPDTLRTKLINALNRDLNTAKNYLRTCRQFVGQADNSGDNETAIFWANQYDNALQNVEAIKYQLKTI